MSYIAKQPNGLLCRFSSITDSVTHYNMTEDEYVEMCAERAREEARYNLTRPWFIRPFSEVEKDIRFDNITEEEWAKLKREMTEVRP